MSVQTYTVDKDKKLFLSTPHKNKLAHNGIQKDTCRHTKRQWENIKSPVGSYQVIVEWRLC